MSLALPAALYLVGIDWAAASHTMCVMDAAGKVVAEFTIDHTADGTAALTRRLAKFGDSADVPVRIERPNGRLVDLLLEAGHPVTPVSPNAIKTWRDAVLIALNTAVKDLDRSVTAHLGEHPDSVIFTSLPRSGQINAAQMLAEWGDFQQAYDSPDAVAALAGVTPVTKESGKHRAVHFRWACNKRFRKASTTFADNSRHASSWAADIYARARANGKDHPHAVRVLAHAWIRVIWRCWHDRTPYDPAKHGAATALNAT